MTNLTIEKIGRRLYVAGNSYAMKESLKGIGCNWDSARRQWWIGSSKAAKLEALLNAPPEPNAEKDAEVVAKAQYKGRTYYVQWMGRTKSGDEKARLRSLYGNLDFWADLALCGITKTYNHESKPTLKSIRNFIAREKENREQGGKVCMECGKSGQLIQDLEDGMMKHYRCCDMPSQ